MTISDHSQATICVSTTVVYLAGIWEVWALFDILSEKVSMPEESLKQILSDYFTRKQTASFNNHFKILDLIKTNPNGLEVAIYSILN